MPQIPGDHFIPHTNILFQFNSVMSPSYTLLPVGFASSYLFQSRDKEGY